MRNAVARIAAVVLIVTTLDLAPVTSARRISAPNGAAAQTASSPAPAGDCCSADAQKQLAASVGFVDIVGIKLGMSPAQVTAALKANGPALGYKVYTSRLTMPSNPNSFVKIPHYIIAHKSPAPAADHSSEYIIVEFTLPPNPPVVARVYRKVTFADGQAVAAGTLISALQKKYGTEYRANSIYHYWLYQTTGQPVTAPLSGSAANCNTVAGTNDGSGAFPGPPVNDNATSTEYGNPISLQNTLLPPPNDNSDTGSACVGYVSVVGTVISPNPGDPKSLSGSMSVAMQSAGLLRDSLFSDHNWMEADLDAKNKKATDDGAARSAPKL